ncbi:MAG TPA: flagellar biosynthetic protein FliR [Candidatus Brocadiia bacterium]|nr:flagellar biosynthetic protein FliR [Candidatus Brocadiia bacterium]
MDLARIVAGCAPILALVLARVTGFVITAPVFGSLDVSTRTKAGLVALLSLVFFPIAASQYRGAPASMSACLILAGTELLAGMALGFGAQLVLIAFQVAGEIIGTQIGLSFAEGAAPGMDMDVTPPAALLNMVSLTGFLLLDIHHWLIEALGFSFRHVGAGVATVTGHFVAGVVNLFMNGFSDGVMAAAPLLGAMLMLTVAMGLMAKAIPNIPILLVGFPIKVVAGLGLTILTVPLVWPVATRSFETLAQYLAGVTRMLGVFE